MALVKICGRTELPAPGQMREMPAGGAEGKVLCVANDGGTYAAVDNVCPHRGGPLAEGSLEDGKVMCPWHAWAFDMKTGICDHDAKEKVAVYPLTFEGDDVMVTL